MYNEGCGGLYIRSNERKLLFIMKGMSYMYKQAVVYIHVKRGVVYMYKERCGLYIQRVWLK